MKVTNRFSGIIVKANFSRTGPRPGAIALDSLDNIYASGGFTKNTILGADFYTNSMFLAKFSPTGVPVWSSNLSEPTNNNMGLARSVVVDLSNRVTVAFQTPTSPFRLGTNSFTNEVTSPTFRGITSSGLAQFSANGALLWMKRAPFNVDGNSGSVGLALVGDRANNIYLRALANLMTNRFSLGVPGLSVLKMQWEGGEQWTNEVKNTPFGISLADGQAADERGLPGVSIAPSGRLAVIGSVYGDRTTLGYIGWTNVLAFTNGTGNSLLTYSIESNYVGVLPQFITQPTNMLFQPPKGLTNYALARAWPVADYRWYMNSNGVAVRIGTNQLLSLAATTVTNVTTYYVVASNLLGQTTDTVVFAQPLLAILPVANSTNAILLGGSGTLSINATGTTAITYQWRFNGTNIAGATSSALVLNNVATNANGLYTVVACNASGCITSAPPITVKVVPPGSIDGTYVTQLTGDAAMVRLSDGRLLAAGFDPGYSGATQLYRGLTNGSFDTNFYLQPPSLGGTYAWWRSGVFDQQGPRAFVVEPDGKILVGGNFTRFYRPVVGWTNVQKMVRLTADGFYDPPFDVGSGPFDFFDSSNSQSGIRALVRQTDGKILAGGNWQRVSGQNRPVLIRLNADGTIDNTFSVMLQKNSATTWPAEGFCNVACIALLPSGKILIGGNGLRVNQTGYDNNAIFQLNADGTGDTNFVAQATGGMTSSSTIAAQADGKILLGGYYNVNRFLPTGALDPEWLFDPSLTAYNIGTLRIMIEPSGSTALMAGTYGIKRILLKVDTGVATPPGLPTGSALRLPNGQFGFTTCGLPGQALVIQASTNLVNWDSISTNSSPGGCIDFIDPQAPQIPNRYYRVLIQP